MRDAHVCSIAVLARVDCDNAVTNFTLPAGGYRKGVLQRGEASRQCNDRSARRAGYRGRI